MDIFIDVAETHPMPQLSLDAPHGFSTGLIVHVLNVSRIIDSKGVYVPEGHREEALEGSIRGNSPTSHRASRVQPRPFLWRLVYIAYYPITFDSVPATLRLLG